MQAYFIKNIDDSRSNRIEAVKTITQTFEKLMSLRENVINADDNSDFKKDMLIWIKNYQIFEVIFGVAPSFITNEENDISKLITKSQE